MFKILAATIVVLVLASSVALSDDYETVLASARALAKAGNPQAAAQLCLEAANAAPVGGSAVNAAASTTPVSPDGPGRDVLIAYALVWNGSPKKDAIDQFLKVADSFPASKAAPDALLHVGYLRDQNGEDSGVDLERLAKDYPSTKEAAEALHCLGHQALRHGDPALALQQFDASAAKSEAAPGCTTQSQIEAAYACISQYWKTSDKTMLKKAISRFTAAKSRQMSSGSLARIHLGLGEAYLILGSNSEAAAEYQAALDANPPDAYSRNLAQFELGCAYSAMRDWQAALTATDAFLNSQPGQTLTEKDTQWKAATPGYSQLVPISPDKAAKLTGLELIPDALYTKANALFHLARYAEAKQLVDDLLQAFPKVAIRERVDNLKRMCEIAIKEGR